MTSSLWGGDRDPISGLRPEQFPVTRQMGTRWRDNDAYGHVNNALYYEFFDTAINGHLLDQLPDDPVWDTTQMFVAESGCLYLKEISFPATVLVAHRVTAIGRTSVTYELALFDHNAGHAGPIAALGRWVHVFVDTRTRKPSAIAPTVRAVLENLHQGPETAT